MIAKRKAAGSKSQKRATPVSDRSSSNSRRRDAGPTASGTFTVRVPLALSRRGGRKVILTPSGGSAWAPRQRRVDNSLIKAIARAHRWKQMMESGAYGSVTELAATEKINQSYVCRVLRLTLLAPLLVEAIMDGRHPSELTLATLMRPFPAEWREQMERKGVMFMKRGKLLRPNFTVR
jgi:hypothetical protein